MKKRAQAQKHQDQPCENSRILEGGGFTSLSLYLFTGPTPVSFWPTISLLSIKYLLFWTSNAKFRNGKKIQNFVMHLTNKG